LILELGNRTDIPVSIWNEWINDGILDLWTALDLPESKRSFEMQLRDGQMLYLLPATVDTVRNASVIDTEDANNGLSLDKIDSPMYRKLPTACGAPTAWFREQNIIVVWPTPDDDYTLTVDAKVKPAKLTLDTQYPIFEDKLHEQVFNAAKARAWTGVQNDIKAQLTENRLAGQIQRRSDRDARDNENEYPTMRVVRSHKDIMRIRHSRHTSRDDC
jgi:hypothetical protein